MDKPTTLSIRDFIIRNLSTELMIPEKVIHDVVAHQFSGAREAMNWGTSIEFSGFGRFVFLTKRAKLKLYHLYIIQDALTYTINDVKTTDRKRASAQYKLGILNGEIKLIEDKLFGNENQHRADNRWMAKPHSPSRED